MIHDRPVRTLLAALLVVAGTLAPLARADEYTDRVNKLANEGNVADKARSDLVILPLAAAMDPAPAVLRTQERAAQLADQGPGWAQCAEWAQKPNQKALFEPLETVTKEEDRKKAHAFGLPYGVEGVNVDLIAKDMYVELGDPPLLAAAQIKYMPALENLGILVHVEASRRFAAGDAKGAIKILTDWLFFCRQVADRPLMQEKKWAMDSMKLALERIRDIVYTDMIAESSGGKRTLDAESLRKANDRLTDAQRNKRGFLQLDKIRLPEGDFIAREQLVKKIMDSSGQPSEATFAPLMARASSTQRPLKLFSAAAFWEQTRAGHAGERATLNMLRGLQADWLRRWELPAFDKYVMTASDYRKFVQTTTKYAALNDAFNDFDSLFPLRQQLRTELAGTRMAIGAYAYLLRHKTIPNVLAAAHDFVDRLDKDPYSPKGHDVQYFIPSVDTPKDEYGRPKPYSITLFPPPPAPDFKRDFDDRMFVIYSVGPDGLSEKVSLATQTRTGVRGDYLLFPPTISLYRQRLLEKNELK